MTGRTQTERRANDLDGRSWTRNSISVWNDIRWTPEELQLPHPAMFPTMLVERLIECFTRSGDRRILDPFAGSGATLAAAEKLGREGIGFEIYPEFVRAARQRAPAARIVQADARELGRHLEPESVDFCVTSPPYWDILTQKRTADYKKVRHYGNAGRDLGRIGSYEAFLEELAKVFAEVLRVLRPGRYMVVNVMDLRKKSRFYPFHADLAARLRDLGFVFDDLVIWDRRQEYNHLRPLGYPAVFRINKIHEYLLIFQKPRPAAPPRGPSP